MYLQSELIETPNLTTMRFNIGVIVSLVAASVDASLPDACEATCAGVAACANDPNYHGSYCKNWQTPAVCFGFYIRPDGTYCFQPNDPSCDDLVLPALSCSAVTAITTPLPSTSSTLPPTTSL